MHRNSSDGQAARRRLSRRSLLKGAALGTTAVAVTRFTPSLQETTASAAVPGTNVAPYVIPSIAGVQTKPLLTVGDLPANNGYRMVGIPDGLGAFQSGRREYTLLMNHELSNTQGIARAHGSKGAFVSKWTIDSRTGEVLRGEDLIRTVNVWDPIAGQYVAGTSAFNRFCSADLPDAKALRHGHVGTREKIFLNGEETSEGRAFAHVVTGDYAGQSWELPRLGKLPFENVVASPNGKRRTIAVVMEDGDLNTAGSRPCQLFIYIGWKQSEGTPVERAGLTNGKLYGVKVTRDGAPVTDESNDYGLGDATSGFVPGGHFTLVEIGAGGDVSALSATQLEADAIAKGLLRMRRIEDGAWDPREGDDDDWWHGRGHRHSRPENDFYFVTTSDITTNSRLWRLRFDDIDDPLDGGTIEILVNGGDVRMLDNICVDGLGRVIMQEDPGNQDHLAKIWAYGIESGDLVEVATHNPGLFGVPAGPHFLTKDEESSGIIYVEEILGRGWYLFDVQAHYTSSDPELVQGGQLLAMYINPRIAR